MKLPIEWLNDYVDISDISIDELQKNILTIVNNVNICYNRMCMSIFRQKHERRMRNE